MRMLALRIVPPSDPPLPPPHCPPPPQDQLHPASSAHLLPVPPSSSPHTHPFLPPHPPSPRQVGTPGEALLSANTPRPYAERIAGKTVAQAGCVPILHMRHFQKTKALSDALVADIRGRVQPH